MCPMLPPSRFMSFAGGSANCTRFVLERNRRYTCFYFDDQSSNIL